MVDMEKRCPSGIDGFDELIMGGFPRARSMLLAGTCGTGKTTFAIQYLVNGILQYNEPGVLVTLEQSSDELRSDMKHYGFDLPKLEEDGKLIIIDTSLSKIGLKDFVSSLPVTPQKSFSLLPGEFDLEKVVSLSIQAAKKINAKRIVLDSLPALEIFVKEKMNIRQMLVNVNYELKSNDLTALIISEMREDDGLSNFEVEEYISDGVILLKSNEALDTRTLRVRKMRTTAHSLRPMTLEFHDNGVRIRPPQKKSLI